MEGIYIDRREFGYVLALPMGPHLPLPHWAIIDMASPKKTLILIFIAGEATPDAKTVQLFVSNTDDPDWA